MRKTPIFLFFLLLTPTFIMAQSDVARKKNFNVKRDIAIEGYDPVSYFDGKPAEGNEALATVYKGITYHFATKTNQQKFEASPSSYEPAYGGWCAFAMGKNGEKVKIDPETYKIQTGKLYLFYNFWGNNTLEEWNKNEKDLKARGDTNWARILH